MVRHHYHRVLVLGSARNGPWEPCTTVCPVIGHGARAGWALQGALWSRRQVERSTTHLTPKGRVLNAIAHAYRLTGVFA